MTRNYVMPTSVLHARVVPQRDAWVGGVGGAKRTALSKHGDSAMVSGARRRAALRTKDAAGDGFDFSIVAPNFLSSTCPS